MSEMIDGPPQKPGEYRIVTGCFGFQEWGYWDGSAFHWNRDDTEPRLASAIVSHAPLEPEWLGPDRLGEFVGELVCAVARSGRAYTGHVGKRCSRVCVLDDDEDPPVAKVCQDEITRFCPITLPPDKPAERDEHDDFWHEAGGIYELVRMEQVFCKPESEIIEGIAHSLRCNFEFKPQDTPPLPERTPEERTRIDAARLAMLEDPLPAKPTSPEPEPSLHEKVAAKVTEQLLGRWVPASPGVVSKILSEHYSPLQAEVERLRSLELFDDEDARHISVHKQWQESVMKVKELQRENERLRKSLAAADELLENFVPESVPEKPADNGGDAIVIRECFRTLSGSET